MGDFSAFFSASDCSWKKIVIAKANNKWISTMKSEQSVDDDNVDTVVFTNFSLEEDGPFGNAKRKNNISGHQSLNVGGELMIQEVDPLLVHRPGQRKRRKSSGFKHETSEERAARLAKMSAYAAQRLANETPEQRALRLKRMSEYAAKRLAQETSEQRALRLARMSAYAARRLAKETPEQRQARLTRMSEYAARRQAMKKFGSSSISEEHNSDSAGEQDADTSLTKVENT